MQDQSCKTPRWKLLKSQLNNLAPIDFMARIQTTNHPIIIDVRTDKEFDTGHIPNATNIDYFDETFWEKIEQHISTEHSIFVYCRSGRRSIRACTLMRNGGFDNTQIFNLEGGYSQWMEEVGNIVSKSE